MIHFKPIDEDNFEDCLSLKLTEEQQEHVASNAYSIIEAYACRNSCEVYYPLIVYKDDTVIGFMMYHYSPFINGDPEYDEPVYYISRMMIDVKYQGNGYGKQALLKLLEEMKNSDEHVDAIVLSCCIKNVIAYKMYQSLGFEFHGETDDDGDHILRLEV